MSQHVASGTPANTTLPIAPRPHGVPSTGEAAENSARLLPEHCSTISRSTCSSFGQHSGQSIERGRSTRPASSIFQPASWQRFNGGRVGGLLVVAHEQQRHRRDCAPANSWAGVSNTAGMAV